MIWSGRKRCSLRAGAVEVVIDEVRAMSGSRRGVTFWLGRIQICCGVPERAEVEQPVGAAVDFLVERCQLPEVESVVHRVDLRQQVEQRMVGHFLDVLGRLGAARPGAASSAGAVPSRPAGLWSGTSAAAGRAAW